MLLSALPFRASANDPDSVYLFTYSGVKDKGRSGLHFAWSTDGRSWTAVAGEAGFLKCDYATLKQMSSPYLFPDAKGHWQCLWELGESIHQFGQSSSSDLLRWTPQRYPYLPKGLRFSQPVVSYQAARRLYSITFKSGEKYYRITTTDFRTYGKSVAVPSPAYHNDRRIITLPSGTVSGTQYKIPRSLIARLTEAWEARNYRNQQYTESYKTDSSRFAALQPLRVTARLEPQNRKPISDMLVGVFFEDLNYSADGGLYGELIQNRDFEYQPADRKYQDSTWNSRHSWRVTGGDLHFTVDSAEPLHPNNPHYALLEASRPGSTLINDGYDGIALKKNEAYEFSLFARNGDGQEKQLLVKLVNNDGAVLAQAPLKVDTRIWGKQSVRLVSTGETGEAHLELQLLSAGRIMLDILSLFPEKTYKNRKNGMRADLAEMIAAIHPRFVRFPGGCLVHGDGLDNMYRWKNTIGPLEARMPQPNIWRYHQSAGLGYYEYFQYCEDIGAAPLPVLPAGVPCQNSSVDSARGGGQQGGIPMNEMDAYIQDVLDLIEWANGPASSRWGRLRAEAGHPEPFHLRYIGIGNEDLISDVFEERFTRIFQALRRTHPEITVIGTAGPFPEGSDYDQGWALAAKLQVPLVDEHYYQSPGWFIHNQHFYDHYDRLKPHVYLGEYASRGNAFYNALCEALYLTGVERNGDVVNMTSYAPLLAREKHTQWNPDLIYFNNTEVKPTVNYEVQKLFGTNAGNEYLPVIMQLSNEEEAVKKRLAVSVVRDTATGTVFIKAVNLLPVAVSVQLDMGGITGPGQAEKQVLQGRPDARQVTVQTSTAQVGNQLEEALAPYSFTVWKIKP